MPTFPVPENTAAFQAAFRFWRSRRLSLRAAAMLAEQGCASVADVLDKGRGHFANLPGVGPTMLATIGAAIGGWQRDAKRLERLIEEAVNSLSGDSVGSRVISHLLAAGYSIQRDMRGVRK
jgi:hypothetical protein